MYLVITLSYLAQLVFGLVGGRKGIRPQSSKAMRTAGVKDEDAGDVLKARNKLEDGRAKPKMSSPTEQQTEVEEVPIEEDDDLRELGSPLRNETPSEGEWMEPICNCKFISFLFINYLVNTSSFRR